MTTITKRRLSAFIKVLVKPAAKTGSYTRHGCDVLDILAQNQGEHQGVSNLTFWSQPTLSCYTPTPDFQAAHSLLADTNAGTYPVPDTSGSPFPTVKWTRTQGTVSAMAVLPDGSPAVHEVKIMDSDPAGAAAGLPWAFSTADLGPWSGGLAATAAGSFDESRGIAVTLRLGSADTPPGAAPMTTEAATAGAGQTAADTSSPGDVRVTVGNIWSVRFPVNADPVFEKRYPYRDKAGVKHEWVSLHTFDGATADRSLGGVPQFLVTFLVIAGRLLVSVNGQAVAANAWCYTEPQSAKKDGKIKTLKIASAPVRVSGRAGGGPRWIGLRRIHWGVGQFSRLLPLGANNPADLAVDLLGWQNAVGDPGFGVTVARPQPGVVYYTAQVRGTGDGRSCAALKNVRAHADAVLTSQGGAYVDYGEAVKLWTENMAQPDFTGAGGTRGSDGNVSLVFDLQGLDKAQAATPGANWRADLSAYAPVTFIVGQVLCNADGTGETEVETARLTGYLDTPGDEALGFADGEVRRTVRDGWMRLKEPAGFVDTSFTPLSVCLTSPDGSGDVYGWQGVKLILSRLVSQEAGDSLRVFLPANHYGLAEAVGDPATLGKMAANDLPLLNVPYGKYAAEWIKQIAEMDFAALYPAGGVWVYGHFNLIVAGTPTYDVYDGRNAAGGALPPDSVLAYSASSLKRVFNTSVDYNRWQVWGDVPGGLGSDAPVNLGAPLITSEAQDYPSVAASWQRTKLFQGGQLYSQAIADAFIQSVRDSSDKEKTAAHYEIEFPFALPEVYWGHKMRLHGFDDIKDAAGVGVDGRVFRVYKMTHTGNQTAAKTATRISLVEMLG